MRITDNDVDRFATIYLRALTTLAVLALLVCAMALACSPSASADSRDDTFWKFLQQRGMASAFTSETQAITSAHAVCVMLNEGYDQLDIGAELKRQTAPTLSDYQVGEFVGASGAAYCPKTWQRIQPDSWAAPTGFAIDPMCVTRTYTQVFGGTVPIPMRESVQVCRGDDGAWFQCAQPLVPCHPIPDQGPAPLPGSTPAPGINGSGLVTP